MLPERLIQAIVALFLAVVLTVLAAPAANSHPGLHQGEAAVAETGSGEAAAIDAAFCCHVVGACSVTLCDDPVGGLSRLSWSRAGLRLTVGASHASLAGGVNPSPPRG